MVRVSEKFIKQITELAKDGAATVNAFLSRIINVSDPIDPQDAATKNYVDSLFNGEVYFGQQQESLPVTNGQTVFILSSVPVADGYVQMFVNGLKQEYGVDYTNSGSVINYTGSSLTTSDVVEFWYLAHLSGAQTGAYLPGITIMDESVQVDGYATTLNFVGSGVQAVQASPGFVNIFIPPPNYLSHWNSSDGSNGDQSVTESITRTTARISTPTSEGSPFITNTWAATDQAASINGTVVNTTPGSTTGFGGDSTITVTVYAGNGSTVLDSFTTPAITGNNAYVSSSGRITITITSYAADSLRFSAKASVSTVISSIFTDNGQDGGRYHIEITHTPDSSTDGTGPYTYVQTDLFYDSNSNTPSISSVAIAETSGDVVTKHLSGIEYYILGSSFTINVTDINNHNRNTSRTSASLLLRGIEYGLPNLDHSPFGTGSGFFSSWTNAYNNTGADYQKTDWEITQANYRYIGSTANVTAQARDTWNSGSAVASSNDEILIDTYTSSSTNTAEFFNDEDYRQDGYFNSGSSTGNWDSIATLGIDPVSGHNEAIVFNGRLMAPDQTTFVRSDGASTANTDWSTYLPNSGGANPDYTGQSVPVVYYRSFVDTGVSRSSFTMTFTGTFVSNATADLINGDLQIKIYKIGGLGATGAPPGNTQPLLAHGAAYNFATFDDGLSNGQIRLGSSSGNTVECTFGGFNMEDGVFCEILITNPAIKIDSVTFSFN